MGVTKTLKSILLLLLHDSLASTGSTSSGVTAVGTDQISSSPDYPSPDWVVGFIEAEGSFTYDAATYNTYPKFCVTQRNKEILEEIIKTIELNTKVYECSDGFYRISFKGKEKTLKLINFLDGRLHTKYSKKRFERWKQIYIDAYGTPAELEVEK